MGNSLIPIVLFVYRRIPNEVIESLLKNELANKSDLFIYSDGFKNDIDKNDVLEVRKYLNTINGFNNVKVIESNKNKGLAKSIIDGVTEIIDNYDKVIVLEDDVIVSTDFINFMNDSLNFYENDEEVWSISAYTPYLNSLNTYNKDVYFSLRGTSWVWATWKNRWSKIDWEINDWNSFKYNKKEKIRFEKSGNDMFRMLELQMLGKLDSWAIRWCYNQFKFKMYTVHPKYSKAINIGFNDEKASNTSGERWDVFDVEIYNDKLYLEKIQLNKEIINELKVIYDLRFYTKIGYFLKKYGGYKIIKNIMKYLR